MLNVTPGEKLVGVAEYFQASFNIFNIFDNLGSTMTQEKNEHQEDETPTRGHSTQDGQQVIETNQEEREDQNALDGKIYQIVKQKLDQEIQHEKTLEVVETPEGLVIDILEDGVNPLFTAGSPILTQSAKIILLKVMSAIKKSSNLLEISGYTEKENETNKANYTGWELSADRANATRRFILANGIPSERIAKIIARADTDLLDPSQPYSSKNRRITITLLRHFKTPFYKLPLPSAN